MPVSSVVREERRYVRNGASLAKDPYYCDKFQIRKGPQPINAWELALVEYGRGAAGLSEL